MIICKPKVFVPFNQFDNDIIRQLERYARVCYKSEKLMDKSDPSSFLRSKVAIGHESIIEHEKATVMFIIDRGISHEIVRHRIAAYSQESTRYCNYSKDKFGKEITVIEPFFFIGRPAYKIWEHTCLTAEEDYMAMIDQGCSPQEARSVLPNSLKTEIVVTFNFREWRHFFKLRCSSAAHPQMRQVAIPLLIFFTDKMPVLFEDITFDTEFPKEHYAEIIQTDSFFNIRG
jgi:thymidylate synthase (FAD)